MENNYISVTDTNKKQIKYESFGFKAEFDLFDTKDKETCLSDSALMEIIKLWDYCRYFGKTDLLCENFEKARTLMEYILLNLNFCGYADSVSKDIIYEESGQIEKNGALGYKQVLLLKALEAMSALCTWLGKQDVYMPVFKKTKKQFFFDYLDGINGLRHCEHEYFPTKYSNIFAILCGYLNGETADFAVKSSLKCDKVAPVTSNTMKFFEFCALCKCGEFNSLPENISDNQKYYIYEKFCAGLNPTLPAFEQFEICPNLQSFELTEGKVQTPKGIIEYYLSNRKIVISCPENTKGTLIINAKSAPCGFTCCKDGIYKLEFERNIDILL